MVMIAGLLSLVSGSMAQDIKWTATPAPDSLIGNQHLFASLSVTGYNFDEKNIRVVLDGELIAPLLRIKGDRLSFLSEGILADGRHRLEVKAVIKELGQPKTFSWHFFVNTRGREAADTARPAAAMVKKEDWKLSGLVTAENRSTFLSGSGKHLRQEPSYTRAASLDMQLHKGNVVIPVKVLVTSDNRFTAQTQNYYQVGFRNKWLELDAGDMNPAVDRLVLTGVRLRGVRAMLKLKANSIQLFYGKMNDAYEGRLEKYLPGAGVLPTNLINDSQFIVSGTYRRRMIALRLDFGGRKGIIKAGLTALKVKDDINSISYGLQPKDNIAIGSDIVAKLFKKTVTVSAGIAASMLTNDISYGVLDPKHFDSLYNITLHFDPQKFEKLIILNTSTIPTYSGNRDFLAYYSQLAWSNAFHAFNFEYRKNGGLYYSLGNPFLRNNYNGFLVSERLNLLKRKANVSGSYQRFSNNLNGSFASKVNTSQFNGSVFANPGPQWPSFYLSYLRQSRRSREIVQAPGIRDRIQNLLVTLSMNAQGRHVNNTFRATFNYNTRNDLLRPETGIVLYNYMAGWVLNMGPRYSLSADAGKLIIENHAKDKITDLFSYSLTGQWQSADQRVYASGGISNNRMLATLFTGGSKRMSVIARSGFKFLRDMAVDIEAGIQPYRETAHGINNFTERYIYLRYTYNLRPAMAQ